MIHCNEDLQGHMYGRKVILCGSQCQPTAAMSRIIVLLLYANLFLFSLVIRCGFHTINPVLWGRLQRQRANMIWGDLTGCMV